QRDERNGTWFRLDARNLGLDTREFRAEWERQGDFTVFMGYDRIPRDEPYSVFTAVRGIGTTTQRVPTPSTTNLGQLHLGTVREAFSVGFAKVLTGGFDFRLSATSEDKRGDRLWGRGGAAEFAAEPIDSNTRQLEAVVSYTQDKLQLQGGYLGTLYTNRNSMVDTALTNGASPFFLSLPLDNQGHQLFMSGGYGFSRDTRGTFKVSYTRITQDEQIPVGATAVVSPTAPTSLNGRLDNTLVQLGLTSRVNREFNLAASLRSYESDEKTPQYRVVGPACPGCVDTTPLTYKSLTGKVEGTYRTSRNLSLVGGLDLSNIERNVPVGDLNPAGFDNQRYVPFRSEVQETTLRLEARRSLAESVNGRLLYAHSKRDGSDYSRTNEPQSDLINPIYLADRDRDKVKFALDWTVVDPLTLTFNVEYAKDKYSTSDARPYGLSEGSAALFSIDAAYTVAENWQLTAFYSRDQTKATQIGQRTSSGGGTIDAIKTADLEDVGDTLGVGVRGQLMPKVRLGADLLYQKNVNKYPESIQLVGAAPTYPAGTTGPLPDITNTLKRLKLNATYALQKNSELLFEYVHELWKTNDWSWMFADGSPFTYGTTTDGTQVVQAPKQSADWFGMRYIYRFR
ncbi:MAG TPA: MtrB/PioB family decaheme-associated outer membrane protein, partial [Burkholderiales bacterium]